MQREEMNRTFGIMRSLLASPSTQTWKRLCGYLDRYEPYWDEPLIQQRELHYIRTQLGAWPEDMPRYAQHLWLTRAMKGKAVPQIEFATAIHLTSQEAGELEIELLFNHLELCNMTHIDLKASTMGYNAVTAILHHPKLDRLKVLDVRRTGISSTLVFMLKERFASPCRVLHSR